VDSAGNPIPEGGGTSKHYFATTGNYLGSSFSFDPTAPSSTDVNGTGVGNVKTLVPPGDYTVVVTTNYDIPGTPRAQYVSPIFEHSYYHQCGDFFTTKSIPCALYELRLYSANYPAHPQGLLISSVVHALPLKKLPDGAPVVPPPGKITTFTPSSN
jgi:hypothetical protein